MQDLDQGSRVRDQDQDQAQEPDPPGGSRGPASTDRHRRPQRIRQCVLRISDQVWRLRRPSRRSSLARGRLHREEEPRDSPGLPARRLGTADIAVPRDISGRVLACWFPRNRTRGARARGTFPASLSVWGPSPLTFATTPPGSPMMLTRRFLRAPWRPASRSVEFRKPVGQCGGADAG